MAYWFEGRALGQLGDLEDALQILEAVQRNLIAEGRLAESALVCVDQARCLAECGRAAEIPSLAEALEDRVSDDSVVRMAGRQLRCLGEIALARKSCFREATQAALSTLRVAFRGHRIRLSPIPFA